MDEPRKLTTYPVPRPPVTAPTPERLVGEERLCPFGPDCPHCQVARLSAERKAIEVAVRKLCPLDNNEGYEDEDEGRVLYRCINEDGDAFIDTESLAEAVEGMVASYDRVCGAFEAKCEETHRLTAEVERLNVEVDFYRALQRTDNSQVIAALTAEVERLKKAVYWAYHEGLTDAVGAAQQGGKWDESAAQRDVVRADAALSLPTPAPEATE